MAGKKAYRVTWISVLVMVVLVVPITFGLFTFLRPTGFVRPVFEFVLGTWPAQQYDDPKPADFNKDVWLYIGVGFRSLIVFAVPAIMTLFAVLLASLERRVEGMGMLVRNIIASRIKFVGTEVYGEFRDDLEKAGVNRESFAKRLDVAIERADRKLREVESDIIVKILNSPVR